MKLSLEEINAALKSAGINPDQHEKIVKELTKIAEEIRAEKEETKAPKLKNEFGIIIYDDGTLAGKELTGAVYQIKAGDDHGTVLSRISDAAREQNENAKRKKNILESIGGCFQNLKRKFIKTKNINLKTKDPVRVLISNNELV